MRTSPQVETSWCKISNTTSDLEADPEEDEEDEALEAESKESNPSEAKAVLTKPALQL